jgi:hypothetical protein
MVMKKLALLLFAIPAFCSAQQNGNIPKPAVDGCPSWNKKSKSDSKAEYFYYLRTNKAKDQQLAPNYSVSSQRTYPSGTIVRYAPEEDPFLIPKRARHTQQVASPAVNNALKAPGAINAAGYTKEEEKSREPEELKAPTKEEPVVNSIEKKEEKPQETKAETTGFGGKQALGGIFKREKRSKRHSNHSSVKKVKACKSGNASKCPSF